jgi:hypothetical protein
LTTGNDLPAGLYSSDLGISFREVEELVVVLFRDNVIGFWGLGGIPPREVAEVGIMGDCKPSARTVSKVGFLSWAGLVVMVGFTFGFNVGLSLSFGGGFKPSNLDTISFIDPFLTCPGRGCGVGRLPVVLVGEAVVFWGEVEGYPYIVCGLCFLGDLSPDRNVDGISSLGGKVAERSSSGLYSFVRGDFGSSRGLYPFDVDSCGAGVTDSGPSSSSLESGSRLGVRPPSLGGGG